jgi:hypothetical protein
MASGERPTSMDSAAEPLRSEPAAAEPASAGAAPAAESDAPAAARDYVLSDSRASTSGRSVIPALAAGIGGGLAVLLAAVAVWLAGLVPSREDSVSPVAARVAAVELQMRDLSAGQPASADAARKDSEGLSARLAKLEMSPPAADPQLTNRVAAAEAAAKSAADSMAVLGRRMEEIAAASAEARSRADAAVAAANAAAAQPSAATAPAIEANKGEIDTLKNRLAAVENADKQQVEKKDLDALTARIAALEQTIAGLDQTAKALQAGQASALARDRAVRLAIVASALNAAVNRGEPYAAELAAAKPLAPPNALAPLEPFAQSGLPPPAALARELSDLLPSLQQKAGAPAAEGGILEKLQANASRLVKIRPVTEQPGDDARAVLARIEFKAAQSDIAGAVAELGKLPPDQRAAAESWMQKAQTRMAAVEASRRVAADAYAALAQLPR